MSNPTQPVSRGRSYPLGFAGTTMIMCVPGGNEARWWTASSLRGGRRGCACTTRRCGGVGIAKGRSISTNIAAGGSRMSGAEGELGSIWEWTERYRVGREFGNRTSTGPS